MDPTFTAFSSSVFNLPPAQAQMKEVEFVYLNLNKEYTDQEMIAMVLLYVEDRMTYVEVFSAILLNAAVCCIFAPIASHAAYYLLIVEFDLVIDISLIGQ